MRGPPTLRVGTEADQGRDQSRIVFFLMNIHPTNRTIWFARSGPSRIEHSYKADSELSPLGTEYADRLCDFMITKRRELRKMRILEAAAASSSSSSTATTGRNKASTKGGGRREQEDEEDEEDGGEEKTPRRPEFKRGTTAKEHLPLTVWTSTRTRCMQTAAPMAKAGYRVLTRSQMNEVRPTSPVARRDAEQGRSRSTRA